MPLANLKIKDLSDRGRGGPPSARSDDCSSQSTSGAAFFCKRESRDSHDGTCNGDGRGTGANLHRSHSASSSSRGATNRRRGNRQDAYESFSSSDRSKGAANSGSLGGGNGGSCTEGVDDGSLARLKQLLNADDSGFHFLPLRVLPQFYKEITGLNFPVSDSSKLESMFNSVYRYDFLLEPIKVHGNTSWALRYLPRGEKARKPTPRLKDFVEARNTLAKLCCIPCSPPELWQYWVALYGNSCLNLDCKNSQIETLAQLINSLPVPTKQGRHIEYVDLRAAQSEDVPYTGKVKVPVAGRTPSPEVRKSRSRSPVVESYEDRQNRLARTRRKRSSSPSGRSQPDERSPHYKDSPHLGKTEVTTDGDDRRSGRQRRSSTQAYRSEDSSAAGYKSYSDGNVDYRDQPNCNSYVTRCKRTVSLKQEPGRHRSMSPATSSYPIQQSTAGRAVRDPLDNLPPVDHPFSGEDGALGGGTQEAAPNSLPAAAFPVQCSLIMPDIMQPLQTFPGTAVSAAADFLAKQQTPSAPHFHHLYLAGNAASTHLHHLHRQPQSLDAFDSVPPVLAHSSQQFCDPAVMFERTAAAGAPAPSPLCSQQSQPPQESCQQSDASVVHDLDCASANGDASAAARNRSIPVQHIGTNSSVEPASSAPLHKPAPTREDNFDFLRDHVVKILKEKVYWTAGDLNKVYERRYACTLSLEEDLVKNLKDLLNIDVTILEVPGYDQFFRIKDHPMKNAAVCMDSMLDVAYLLEKLASRRGVSPLLLQLMWNETYRKFPPPGIYAGRECATFSDVLEAVSDLRAAVTRALPPAYTELAHPAADAASTAASRKREAAEDGCPPHAKRFRTFDDGETTRSTSSSPPAGAKVAHRNNLHHRVGVPAAAASVPLASHPGNPGADYVHHGDSNRIHDLDDTCAIM